MCVLRTNEHEYLRWIFAGAYILEGSMLSAFLIVVASGDGFTWICNVASDLLLIAFFLVYCRNNHLKRSNTIVEQSLIYPANGYLVFPGYFGMILGIVLTANMFIARLPALYYNYDNMNNAASWTNYPNATLLISCSVIPIALYAQYWSVSFMLFHKEFTACPGKYVPLLCCICVFVCHDYVCVL